MSPLAWVLLSVAALAAWAWLAGRSDPVRLADRAATTGDAGPLLARLHRVRAGEQPTEYHRVLKRLWDGYHREVGVAVAMDLATSHREAPVAQYWLKRFLDHEPEIAQRHLDDAFLEAFYDAGVAAKCGSFG